MAALDATDAIGAASEIRVVLASNDPAATIGAGASNINSDFVTEMSPAMNLGEGEWRVALVHLEFENTPGGAAPATRSVYVYASCVRATRTGNSTFKLLHEVPCELDATGASLTYQRWPGSMSLGHIEWIPVSSNTIDHIELEILNPQGEQLNPTDATRATLVFRRFR